MAWHGRLVGDWHGRLAQGNVGRSSLNRRFARAGARIQVLSFLMREAINGNQHAIRDDQGRCAHTSALILARAGRDEGSNQRQSAYKCSHSCSTRAEPRLGFACICSACRRATWYTGRPPSRARRRSAEREWTRYGGSSIDREGSTGEEGGHQARETTGAKTGARTWALAMQRSASTCFHIGWPLASRLHTLAYTPRQGTWHLSAAISEPGLSPDRESFCGISLIDVATCAGGHGAQSTYDQRALLHSRDGF